MNLASSCILKFRLLAMCWIYSQAAQLRVLSLYKKL
jgi:hypothetical protein